ncbi:hypothetical protein FS827_00060 [Agrobacterium vitis]|uniref:hypothetical protein n=1 Tax=Allorhizobium ampelinum TaxID=3025782 RepID=UPI001F44F894|nr:hypothetical protein [Allorhizobium ampelinum]MCF1459708.1 hypothetical protein [Allorhizobium ampelinum]
MRDIADTIKAGERNRDTMVLVRNYCANARFEKFGGTGIIEQTMGLPIGHHGMRCDFAPEGGMACWDLRDAVIDFYDRNCAGCQHRQPLRLPNLLEIIAERDRARAAREARDAFDAELAAKALENRNAIRALLAPGLGTIARTLLDDIGLFDAHRTTENFERVTQSARLAPEHFTPELVAYVSGLAKDQPWFAEAALIILDAVHADDVEIVTLATATLRRGYPDRFAVDKLLPRIHLLSADVIPDIVGSAIDLAHPDDREFIYGDGEQRISSDPAFLVALYRQFHNELTAAIELMLLSGKRASVERAGRGLQALRVSDAKVAAPVLRTLVSVYVRAPSLVSDLKDDDDRLPDLAYAVNDAFDASPHEVDELLQSFNEGAPPSHRARVAMAYARAVHVGYNEQPVPATSPRHSLALTRLIWTPTVERHDKVLEEVTSAFSAGSSGLELVVRAQLDAFVGALFLLDDRLAEMEAEKGQPGENFLTAMERNTKRSVMRGLMDKFVEWASEAAAGDDAAAAKIIGMFDAIPDGRDNLLGALLGATKELSGDLVGLKLVLPHLYRALVGSSVLGRSYAATAVGELPYRSRSNIPDLLFEAFGALLWDQYVAVHKSAVNAFHRSILPEQFRPNAALAILNLIHYYRVQSNEDQFLTECVRIVAGMADLFGERSVALRRYLIEVAMGIDPLYLRSVIQSLSFSLGSEPEFAKLAARMIPHLADRYNQSDKAMSLLGRVPPDGLRANAQAFHDAAIAVLDRELMTTLGIVEAFLRADMPDEADALVTALLAVNGDTVRMRRRGTLLRWPQLALRFERAVSDWNADAISEASRAWSQAAEIDTQDEEDGRERRARSGLPF